MRPYIEAQKGKPCYPYPIGVIDAIAFLQATELISKTNQSERIIGLSFNARPGQEFLSIALQEPSFDLALNGARTEMCLVRAAESAVYNLTDAWNSPEFLKSFTQLKAFTKQLDSGEISFSGSPTGHHGTEVTVDQVLRASVQTNHPILVWWQRPKDGPFQVSPTTAKQIIDKID